MKLRVLSLHHKPPFPAVDGGTRASSALLEALVGEGLHVQALACATARHPATAWPNHRLPAGAAERFRYRQVPLSLDGIPGALRSLVGWGRGLPIAASRYRSSALLRAVAAAVLEFDPDVVLLDGFATLTWLDAVLDARRRSASDALLVYRAHNAEAELVRERARFDRGLLSSLWFGPRQVERTAALERRSMRSTGAQFAISASVAERLVSLGGDTDSFSVLPVPMPACEAPSAPSRSVLVLAAMDWWPNQQGMRWFLTEVWPKVTEPGELTIAGRRVDRWRNRNRSWLDRLERRADLRFVSDPTDLDALINAHGVQIAPLLACGGVSIKVLEALSFGRAVVTTTPGFEGLGVRPGKDLLVCDSADEFALGLDRLLADAQARAQLGEAGRAYVVDHHEPTAIARRFQELVRRHQVG